jgi:serine/threonine protein kinase
MHAAGESGALVTLFKHQRILELQSQTIQAGLARNRDALLAGLNKAFTASLPFAGDRSAQILEDLAAMNQTGRLPDGSLPLETWLENACALTSARTEGEVFRSALNDLLTASATTAESFSAVGDWRAITRSLPSPPSYPDVETRRLSEQLEDAQARKWAIAEVGGSTAEVDEEIRELRRRLREGGQLKAGDSLGNGRYLLLERLGRGGFAVVWKAHDRGRNERVAVKVLHSELAGDPVRKARFFRGARVMASIEHEAVVRVLDPHAEDSGYHYFVMELVAGGDLRHAVLEGRLTRDRVIPLILRVGEVVAIAHQRYLVHRDIKPANILLDANREPKLSDFDLVGGRDTTGGTRTGPMGTMFYAAPEAMKNAKEVDARADVYSLGMTAVFALSGSELPMDVLRDANVVIDGLACTSDLKDVLRQATAWEREERFAGAGAFCEAVRDAISGKAKKPPAPAVPEFMADRRSQKEFVVIEPRNEVPAALESQEVTTPRVRPSLHDAVRPPAQDEPRDDPSRKVLPSHDDAIPPDALPSYYLPPQDPPIPPARQKKKPIAFLLRVAMVVLGLLLLASVTRWMGLSSQRNPEPLPTGLRGGPLIPPPLPETAEVRPLPPPPEETAKVRPLPPQPGENGTLLAVAVGGSCAFSVNGTSKGISQSIRVELKPGTYLVACKPDGGDLISKTVTVKSGETARVPFPL